MYWVCREGPLRITCCYYAAPAGQGRAGFVAAADVAAVAARVLVSQGHEGATYLVTGPEALGYADVAARVSAVFGREVGYEDQPPELARDLMLADGLTPWMADGNLELFEWIREGGTDTVSAAVREVTGADPHSVEDWLSKSRARFLSPPPDLAAPNF